MRTPRGETGPSAGDPIQDYRYPDKTRKNLPPAGGSAQHKVREVPKHRYESNPHLPPVLRFDPAGVSDRLPDLLETATRRALTPDEAKLLADALRNREPWLEWAGKREAKACEVDPVALHIHERVSAQAILRVAARQDVARNLFADPEQEYRDAVRYYEHDVEWANRLILGDSLQVMASLAKREDLAGKVQMIYIDPPYGIKFASNFQAEVGKRDVKDKAEDFTREIETVKAYRDTWTLGVHSYLGYLRDRFFAAKELLADTGSIFVQIGVEKTHSRPRVSNDNPYSESQFKTMKYRPTFPDRFGSIQDARQFCADFFDSYNNKRRRSGIAMLTPDQMHNGQGERVICARRKVLSAAYAAHPERFVLKEPEPQSSPAAAWINQPEATRSASPDAGNLQ